jgi:CNT family concentrative nucleoside transporter
MELATDIFRGVIGLVSLLGICYLLSNNRKAINWQLVVMGVGLQLLLGVLLIHVPFVRMIFQSVVSFFVMMIGSTEQAAQFLFGELAVPGSPYGFAFFVLPTIVFFSALSSLLYYLGILQKIVFGFAWIMSKSMKLSGAESLAAAANVFIGQTEAPLVVKPYLERMTKSEIMCLMTGGMATIAGGVFGAYIAMLGGDSLAEKSAFGMHLLTASIISAPAAIVAAKIMVPETNPDVNTNLDIPRTAAGSNFLDAISRGTTDGLKLAVNVGAMLLAFMAFIYLSNKILGSIGEFGNINQFVATNSDGLYDSLSLQYLLGFVFAPIAWLIGTPAGDLMAMGQLLGEKTILNEFVAYSSLEGFKEASQMSEKSIILATYALCGFANFASIGIQIGGIGSIAPGQRTTLTELGIKALIGGTIACLLTATIAGILI